MLPRPAGRQLGLFDNPLRAFSLEELTEAVRQLERQRPGQTVEEISSALFAELGMKRTRRASDLVSEAIKNARPREPRAITGSRSQASTSEVREWAASQGFQIDSAARSPHRPSPPTTRHTQTGHTEHHPATANTADQRRKPTPPIQLHSIDPCQFWHAAKSSFFAARAFHFGQCRLLAGKPAPVVIPKTSSTSSFSYLADRPLPGISASW